MSAADSLFRGLLEAAPDAMIVVDRDSRVLLVNGHAERLFGCTGAELAGQPVEALIPERFRASHRAHHAGFFADPRARPMGSSGEAVALRKDGTEIAVELSLSPIETDDGMVVVAAVRDVTERRKLRERVALSDRLASVGTLAAGVAHEINNPLSFVIGNLDMIAEAIRELWGESPAGRVRDLIDIVNDAREGAERIRKIVRSLKTFSRPDPEKRTALDLRPVIEMAIAMAQSETRHRARVVRDYREAPLVDADEARLGQVFVNLLVNAAQAISEGDAEANEIRVTTRTGEDGRAVIEVRDTGTGIDPQVQARVFDPFFTTKPAVGTGLGLSICHAIVASLGGEIGVDSEPGKGACFRVTLPVSRAQEAVPQSRGPRPASERPAHRGRVLVVDDDDMVGGVVRRVLKDHDVVLASSGAEVLDRIVGGERFDVILCDLMMPRMTGMELHDRLFSRDPALAERMIFITGGAFTPAARDFLDRVPNERLEKPFDAHSLRAVVGCRVGRG